MELNRKTIYSYREQKFGLATGLLIDDLRHLTITIVRVYKTSIARYIQVVPKVARMPDMEEVFAIAVDSSI